jgi:ATP-dependent Lhr-like helicase
MRSDDPAGVQVLAATDPANPYGATLSWPRRGSDQGRRPARTPGAYVVTLDAEPVLYVERGGRGLLALREPTAQLGARESVPAEWLRAALEALADAVRRGRVPRIGLERFDGEPVIGSPIGALLIELGFRQGPRRLTLSA